MASTRSLGGSIGRAPGARSALAVGVVLAMIGIGPQGPVGLLLGRHGPHRRASVVAVPALPRLGAAQVVDRNDVGDPFVLAVPAGVDPPVVTGVAGDPRDPYESAPWTTADAARAAAHGWYVLLGTTDWQSNVPAAISTDLVHWTQVPDALPVLPSWAEPTTSMTWAPAAWRGPDGWVMWYSTEEAGSHRECIGAAVAADPAGPYVDRAAAPLVCQRSLGGSIDPSVVRDRLDGTEWLVWKSDGNGHHLPDALWSAPLSNDGLHLDGAPRRLLGADEPWDAGIVEAPAMLAAGGGGYWLWYSAGSWRSTSYGTGLAWCPTPAGPCVETSSSPFLATTPTAISPGGLDTVAGPDGRTWAAWSTLVAVPSHRHPGRTYYDRVLDVAPLLSR